MNSKAFTLIELLVVISIIGILTTLVAANLNSARGRARDAQRKSDLKNISTALRLYYNDNGGYPVAGSFPSWGSKWKVADTVYMNAVPGDPLPDQVYKYQYADSDNFILSACLENKSDINGKTITISGWVCESEWVYQIRP